MFLPFDFNVHRTLKSQAPIRRVPATAGWGNFLVVREHRFVPSFPQALGFLFFSGCSFCFLLFERRISFPFLCSGSLIRPKPFALFFLDRKQITIPTLTILISFRKLGKLKKQRDRNLKAKTEHNTPKPIIEIEYSRHIIDVMAHLNSRYSSKQSLI
jgi:hypothetical protein